MLLSKESYIGVPGGKIWSQIIYTDANKDKTPLIFLHGGPGGYHDKLKWALEPLASICPLIFYDQLGGGNSKLNIEKLEDNSLWQTPRFVQELEYLIKFYNLSSFHLFGTSWGCTLALEYFFTSQYIKPQSLILSSPLVNTEIWIKDANRLKSQLPKDIYTTLIKCEESGNTSCSEYETAAEFFNNLHVLKTELLSAEQLQFIKTLSGKYNLHSYLHMWGPTEFFATGNLKNYDRLDDLSKINIPTLFMCGEFDEATPESVKLFHSKVAKSQFSVFKNCSHQAYFESPETYRVRLAEFLTTLI